MVLPLSLVSHLRIHAVTSLLLVVSLVGVQAETLLIRSDFESGINPGQDVAAYDGITTTMVKFYFMHNGILSPDGSQLLLVRTESTQMRYFAMSMSTGSIDGQLFARSRATGDTSVYWWGMRAPGEERLLVLYDNSGGGRLGWCQTDGSNLEPLTDDLPANSVGNAAVSPDRTHIAYYLHASGDIYVMDMDGGNKAYVHTIPASTYYRGLVGWLDADTILYGHETSPASSYLYAVDIDGSNDRLLISPDTFPQGTNVAQVRVSPDGTTIAFSTQEGPWGPSYDIMLADADGGNIRTFYADASNNHGDYSPFWSRDGSRLYWVHEVSPGTGGSEWAIYYKDVTPAIYPVWSLIGSPLPVIRPGEGYGGGNALDLNGDGWCDSVLESVESFDLSRGLRVRWRMLPQVQPTQFQRLQIGITSDELQGGLCNEGYHQPITSLALSLDASEHGLHWNLASEWGDPGPIPYIGNTWIQCDLVLHPDGRTSIWIDDVIVAVVEEPIDFNVRPFGHVWFGGRSMGTPDPVIDDIEVYTDITISADRPVSDYPASGLFLQSISAHVDGSEEPAFADSPDYIPNHQLFDVDADGDIDLVYDGPSTNTLAALNTGTARAPRWQLDRVALMDPHNPRVPADAYSAVDYDLDGDLDIVGRSPNNGESHEIHLWRNDAPAGVLDLTYLGSVYAHDDPSERIVSIASGDLNADGREDLIYATVLRGVDPESNNNHVYNPMFHVLIGDGVGANPDWQALQHATVEDQDGMTLTLLDCDDDGDLDLVLVPEVTHTSAFIDIVENTGDPTAPVFSAQHDWIPITDYSYNSIVTSGDLDGDSHDELLFSTRGGRIQLYSWDESSGEYALKRFSFLSQDMGSETKICLDDFDADGDYDLLAVDYKGSVAILWNVGSPVLAQWESAEEVYALTMPDWYSVVASVDLDADQDKDLLLGTMLGRLNVLWNDGTSTSPAWVRYEENYASISSSGRPLPAAADLDGDGDADLLVGAGDGTVAYYENVGSPTTPSWSLVDSMIAGVDVGYCAHPATVDVDYDGDLDVVVGSLRGDFWLIENTGSESGPVFELRSSDFIPEARRQMGSPAFGDIDGDGDWDMFLGQYDGSITQWINSSQRLRVTPTEATVVAGSAVLLAVDSPQPGAALEWSVVSNYSGGSLSGSSGPSTVYNAGSSWSAQRPDVIKVRDLNASPSLPTQITINVISPDDVAAAGKAVIMAGRRPNDPLWQATNYLAHSVFGMLRHRGFDRANIQYLNPEPDQDVDGDGELNDITAPSTFAALEQALTVEAVGSPNLIVYLIDHGDADDVTGANGFIRLNETETVSASQVAAWLDELQLTGGVERVTLVVDCCQSGSFLVSCAGVPDGAPPTAERIVVCSSGATQPSAFHAGGLASFTNAFVQGVRSGLTVGEAFDIAAGAVDRDQQPVMDDDGDGVYNRDVDGAIADQVYIGASFIAGADRPQIANISGNQALEGGVTETTAWASGVASVYAIDRVWAVLTPPSFRPTGSTDPSEPILGLPELELTWSPTLQRYEATTNTFTEFGTYAVNIYARDIWGGVSYPKQSYITQTESDERMAILVGDGPYSPTADYAGSANLGHLAYTTARSRWLTDEQIDYLSSAARPEVDAAPTLVNLDAAITAAADSERFTVYLVGGTVGGALDVDGNGTGDLTVAALDSALDVIQSDGRPRVTVILEFIGSGDWLAGLTPPAGAERIVLTSAQPGQQSLNAAGGFLSFSQWLFASLIAGTDILDAYWNALDVVEFWTGFANSPALDDNGNGAQDYNDGLIAMDAFIGAAFLWGNDPPAFTAYAAVVNADGTSGTLWAEVTDADGIAAVWAYTAGGDVVTSLTWNGGAGRWETPVSGFSPTSPKGMLLFARDSQGAVSTPRTIRLPWSPDSHDLFDHDDLATTTLNFISRAEWWQNHNLARRGDVDWARFVAEPATSYEIRVDGPGPECNAAIELRPADDPTSIVAQRDDGSRIRDLRLTWACPYTTATAMLVRVAQSPGTPDWHGRLTSYTLKVYATWGDNAGLVTIAGSTAYSVDQPAAPLVLGLPTRYSITDELGVLEGDYLYTRHGMVLPAGTLAAGHYARLRFPEEVRANPATPDPLDLWAQLHPGNAAIVQLNLSGPSASMNTEDVVLPVPAGLTIEYQDVPVVLPLDPRDPAGATATVLDVPTGASAAALDIFAWQQGRWQVIDDNPTLNPQNRTVTTQLQSLYGGVYAAGIGAPSAVHHWELFE